MPTINFNSIRATPKSQHDSFEALATFLFQRSFAAATGSEFTSLRGDGGDGGVEAYFREPAGAVHGVQAKYFFKLGSSEFGQIKDSLKAALQNYAELRSYCIYVPFDLTGRKAAGKLGKSETEKFEEWRTAQEAAASKSGKSLHIVLIGATKCRGQLLSLDHHGGLRRYWFDDSNDLLEVVTGLGSKDSSFIGWVPPVAAAPIPTRVIPVRTLVCLLRAIRTGQTVIADYQSMSRPTPLRRILAPHAIAFDGFRWHARAYCFARKDFRDFVLARMLTVELGEPSPIDATLDSPWTNNVRLVLVPHPQLSESRRRVVELDYGMVHGEAVVECRQALLFYMLKHLGFNQPQGSSLTKQVALKNEAELRALLPQTTE